jgi:hypothetical protein
MTTLTGKEKLMNMAKLGTVSTASHRPAKTTKPNNGGVYSLIRYTLCAIYTDQRAVLHGIKRRLFPSETIA